jgi:quercetin dioxygenase-like cupin family protein
MQGFLGRLFRRVGRWSVLLASGSVFAAVPADDVEWYGGEQKKAAVTLYMKRLFEDPATGNEFRLVRYPAGEMNPDHTHPVPHAMFVLEGELVTHKGTFGPNTFVWFPANEVMRHGAGPDADVVVLFFSDGDLRTDYVGAERRA